ncbi:retrotransposon protein, putative, ty1-copia subclass [Tanacetum coccineum]
MTKTSANSDIQDFPLRYQVYQRRLLSSFQDDAKNENVGQDTRSQDGKDDEYKQGKDLKISESKTNNFIGFARNYNMHNMGKTIGELHALLIKYEKDLPKKAATPQVMAIQCGRIQKANKKSLNAKGKGKGKGKGKDKNYIPKPKNPKPYAKEHPTKDDACHHCKKVGHCKRNCPAYLAELIKKKK